MINFVSMGIILKNARREKHISQELAAELANVTTETIRNIEHGNTFPRLETVFALWDIYELPKEDIWQFYTRSGYADEQLKKHKKKTELAML